MRKVGITNIILYSISVVIVFIVLAFGITESNFDSLIIQDAFPKITEGLVSDVVTEDNPFVFDHAAEYTTIRHLSIMFTDVQMPNEGRVNIDVDTANEHVQLTVEAEKLAVDNYTDISLDKEIKLSQGDNVTITVRPDKGSLKIALGDDETPCIRMVYASISRKKSILLISSLLFLYLILVITISFVFRSDKRYIAILAVTGLLYTLVVPYSQVSDDIHHFSRVFEISEGYIISPMTWCETGKLSPGNLESGVGFGDPYSEIIKGWKETLDYENMTQYGSNNTALYSPVAYIPQLIGVWIGRVLTNRVMFIVTLSRLSALLCGLFMLWIAFRIIPVDKGILATITFIPIFINEMCSPSLDSFVNAYTLLFFAVICTCVISEDVLSPAKWWFIFLSPFILGMSKVVYLPFIILLFAIPYERFGTKMKKWLTIAASSIPTIILYAWWTRKTSPFIDEFMDSADHKAQITYVFAHPVEYVQVILRTLKTWGDFYFWGMFGDSLGWVQNIHINKVYLIAFLIIFVIMAVKAPHHKILENRKFVISLIVVVIMVFGLTFSALYAQFNVVASPIIYGIQGRYFLPILLPCVVILQFIVRIGNKTEAHSEKSEAFMIMMPAYFYLFIGWMEATMMLTVIRELWH